MGSGIRYTYQTLIERLIARDYYVSGALNLLPFVVPRPLTEQAAFPYIRLLGLPFSAPPLYETGSGLCGLLG